MLGARFGQTSADTVQRSRAALDRVDACLLGVALNGIPVADAEGYGYDPEVLVEDRASLGEMLR